jgi:hypothetical protein
VSITRQGEVSTALIALFSVSITSADLCWTVAISPSEKAAVAKLALDFLPRPATMPARQH